MSPAAAAAAVRLLDWRTVTHLPMHSRSPPPTHSPLVHCAPARKHYVCFGKLHYALIAIDWRLDVALADA
jgi:hypothetical protein